MKSRNKRPRDGRRSNDRRIDRIGDAMPVVFDGDDGIVDQGWGATLRACLLRIATGSAARLPDRLALWRRGTRAAGWAAVIALAYAKGRNWL